MSTAVSHSLSAGSTVHCLAIAAAWALATEASWASLARAMSLATSASAASLAARSAAATSG